MSEISALRLDDAIEQARRSGAAGNLWTVLLNVTQAKSQDLRDALRNQHGVVVLDQLDLDSMQAVELATEPGKSSGPAAWLLYHGKPHLLCNDPWSPAAMAHLSRRPDAVPALALPQQLEQLLLRQVDSCPVPDRQKEQSGDDSGPSLSPVVAFLDTAIAKAYEDGASDIHFEVNRRGIGVKYRIDGVMSGGERLDDLRRAEEVISRIKVMSQLDITERRRPQD